MEIIVCIKQVPGTNLVEVDPETGVLKRNGIASKLNPYDLFALELALGRKEKHGGRIRVITMGPPQAAKAVEEAACMGAEEGVVLSDRAFAGADVLATSYTLAQGIRRAGRFDLVICGRQTTDGDTAQVGAELAEHLGIPHAGNVMEVVAVDTEKKRVTISTDMDATVYEESLGYPCVLCCDGDINTARLPSYRRKKENEGNRCAFLSLADLEDGDETHYGLSGSATKVEKIYPPDGKKERSFLTGTDEEQALALAKHLRKLRFI